MKIIENTLKIDNTVSILKSENTYFLISTDKPTEQIDNFNSNCQKIKFQNGLIKENGINGVTEASLILILIDRFENFQKSDFPCYENETILDSLYHILFEINIKNKR